MTKRTEVEVEGRRLSLSNLDKVIYPQAGFTKGELLSFYTRVAPAVLPHLASRPLTLKRYPNGVEAPFFYEKQAPAHRPDWVRTARLEVRGGGRWGREREDKPKGPRPVDFVVCDDLPTLVWLAQLGDLELHTSLARVDDYDTPHILGFDLDPGPGTGLAECCAVALALRGVLDPLGLRAWPKTSGSKGMQVYVPLNGPSGSVSYEDTKPFALAVAQLLEKQLPDLVTPNMAKAERPGKVFVDWSQNDRHKTTVSVYSMRATPRPQVSTPLTWDEVEHGDADALVFSPDDVLARVDEHGDLFAPVATLQQQLPALR